MFEGAGGAGAVEAEADAEPVDVGAAMGEARPTRTTTSTTMAATTRIARITNAMIGPREPGVRLGRLGPAVQD